MPLKKLIYMMTKILSLLKIHSSYCNTTAISDFSCAEGQGTRKANGQHKEKVQMHVLNQS